jgi:hypothetical protein
MKANQKMLRCLIVSLPLVFRGTPISAHQSRYSVSARTGETHQCRVRPRCRLYRGAELCSVARRVRPPPECVIFAQLLTAARAPQARAGGHGAVGCELRLLRRAVSRRGLSSAVVLASVHGAPGSRRSLSALGTRVAARACSAAPHPPPGTYSSMQ